jgi:PTS system galactitol-specific IIA component
MKALGDLLIKSAILLNYEAEDAKDVVTVLGKRLQKAGYVTDTFIKAALIREESLPTGLPLSGAINAAIPHTDVEHVIEPGVAMATLTSPIPFHNMAQPDETVEVRLVFLLALDQPKKQIEMLQEIACVLQNPELINSLMNAATPEEVVNIVQLEEK